MPQDNIIITMTDFMNAYDCRKKLPTITKKCFHLGAQIYETQLVGTIDYLMALLFSLKIAGAAGVLGSHSRHPNA